MAETLDELLTIEGVAERAGCSVSGVRWRMARGMLQPSYTFYSGKPGTPGRRVLLHVWTPHDVDAHFDEYPIEPKGPGYPR